MNPHQRSLGTFLFMVGVLLLAGCHTPSASKPDGSKARQIYDMQADGEIALQNALSRAQAENKRVLLSLGANWCSDSQKTYDLLKTDPEIANLVQSRFVPVMVDANNRVGYQRNAAIVERYEVSLDRGIPVLLVLSPTGQLLTTDSQEWPEDSDHEHPERILEYLARWQAN